LPAGPKDSLGTDREIKANQIFDTTFSLERKGGAIPIAIGTSDFDAEPVPG
jgi:hypothetical protein